MTKPPHSPIPSPDPASSDEALLARFSGGDDGALEQLAARHEAALIGLAASLLGNRRESARDVVQEAWLRVIRSARFFDRRSTFRTWMYRIVINKCSDERDKAGVRERAKQNGTLEHAVDEASGGRGEGVGASDELAPLRAAMEHLTPEQRLVLTLCYHRDFTQSQAAEVLGWPVGTLKTRLYAALGELKSRLAGGVVEEAKS